MKIRWAARTLEHLEQIHDYISVDSPDAADRTIEKILESAERLTSHPKLGRPGRSPGRRELIHPPFIIVYSEVEDVINIEAVFHGNRKY